MATPSEAEGVGAADEKRHRFFACELIQEAGILLSLPQVVLATAQSLLHRFYAGQSVTDFDAFRVAMGCIFLAAKAEEQPRRIKDVIQVFFRMRNRRMGLNLTLLMPSNPRFSQWSDWIIMVERQLLIEVGFSIDTMTEHPHKFLLYYVKILDGSNALAQKAWNYVNDSFRVDLCMRYDAHVIACAAISLAARVLGVALPDKWDVLLGVDVDDMNMVAREMLALESFPKVRWIEPLTVIDPYEMVRGESLCADEAANDAVAQPEAEFIAHTKDARPTTAPPTTSTENCCTAPANASSPRTPQVAISKPELHNARTVKSATGTEAVIVTAAAAETAVAVVDEALSADAGLQPLWRSVLSASWPRSQWQSPAPPYQL
ncbi:cyclin-L1 [Achlya hypogyna]|uniref:Cyclin-L1 n=1 Tax=Achlya hypogyna TaxID=1202772 RepID=A0A1V9ZFA6_ACHHY|nr:cyclin-L1 [Achlya hypogyna]